MRRCASFEKSKAEGLPRRTRPLGAASVRVFAFVDLALKKAARSPGPVTCELFCTILPAPKIPSVVAVVQLYSRAHRPGYLSTSGNTPKSMSRTCNRLC